MTTSLRRQPPTTQPDDPRIGRQRGRRRRPRNFTALALIATAAAVSLAGPAHAETYDYFQSPSGNIGCEMISTVDGTGSVVCKLKDHTWVAPLTSGGNCEYSGSDLKLVQGDAPCAGVWPSQIFLLQQPQYGGLQALAYGQTRSIGLITCESEPSGVTCTDSSTGHFFRVSRESYEIG